MKRLYLVSLALLGLLLSGCASVGAAGGNDPLQALGKFAQADLQAALADATAHQDQVAINCYTTLLAVLGSVPSQPPQVKGAVSAFQFGRDLLSSGGGGASRGCSRV
mgnify:CR=1 FL=1